MKYVIGFYIGWIIAAMLIELRLWNWGKCRLHKSPWRYICRDKSNYGYSCGKQYDIENCFEWFQFKFR